MAKITRFGVLKMAGFMGIYGAFIGLISGILLTIMSIGLGSSLGGTEGAVLSGLFGIGAIIFMPIIYGITGFLGGLIFTPIMNLILRMIHGLDLDIEMQGSMQHVPHNVAQQY